MNPKATGLLFVVMGALAAFVWFYEIRGEEGRLAEEAAAKRLFTGFESADVTSIALTSNDGTPVRVERVEGGWALVDPLPFPADDFALDAMASALAELDGGTAIDDPQPDAVYGLDDARAVRFSAGAEEHELRIGDSAPVGSSRYVTRGGSGEVHLVPSHRVNVFDKRFDDLRNKLLLDFDTDAVDHIEVAWPDGSVVLDKRDEGWQISSPIARPADQGRVSRLLHDLSMLRATGFVDDPPAAALSGLDAPAFSALLSGGESVDQPEPFEVALAIGSLPDGGGRLARAGQHSLYRIAAERLADLPTRVSEYRFKQLAEFDALAAGRIEVVFHTAEGTTVPISAIRGDTGWSSEPEAFAPGKLSALVGSLAKLRAADVVAEAMGPEELAGVGLSPANAVLRVYAKRDPDEPEAREPLLAEVSIGDLRGSEGIVAKSASADTVYVLGIEQSEYIPVSYRAFGNHFRAGDSAGDSAEDAAVAPSETPEALH